MKEVYPIKQSEHQARKEDALWLYDECHESIENIARRVGVTTNTVRGWINERNKAA